MVEVKTNVEEMDFYQGCTFTFDSLDWPNWESGELTLMNAQWKLGLKKDEASGKLGAMLQYIGPGDKVTLSKMAMTVGVKTPKMEKLEGILVFEKTKAMGFKELMSLDDAKAKFEEDKKLEVHVRCTMHADALTKRIEAKMQKLIKERNSLHKSLQHLSLSDKDAAVLTEEIATQPEIIRQYDGFKNEAKTLVFELDEKFSDDMYNMLEDLSTRVQSQAEKNYTKRATEIIKVMGLDDGTLGVITSAIKLIVRKTYKFNPKELDGEGEKVCQEIVDDTKFKGMSGALNWAKFVWALTQYQFGNSSIFVNWESIGTEVKFNAKRHKSIAKGLEKDAPCKVVVPMLTTREVSAKDSDDEGESIDDEEPLSVAIVMT